MEQSIFSVLDDRIKQYFADAAVKPYWSDAAVSLWLSRVHALLQCRSHRLTGSARATCWRKALERFTPAGSYM